MVLLVLALSCNGPRRISRDEMVNIYHDMFLQDQLLRNNSTLRRTADTLLVYEGIFQSYGYDTDDYLYSVAYYIKDPEKFSKVFAKVAERLEAESKDLKKEAAFLEWKDKLMAIYQRTIDTVHCPKVPLGAVDTMYFRLNKNAIEFFPPEDSLSYDLDTMVIKVQKDSL